MMPSILEPPAFGMCTKDKQDFRARGAASMGAPWTSPRSLGASVGVATGLGTCGACVTVASCGAGVSTTGEGWVPGRNVDFEELFSSMTPAHVLTLEVRDTSDRRKAPATKTREAQTTTRVRKVEMAALFSIFLLRRVFSWRALERVSPMSQATGGP